MKTNLWKMAAALCFGAAALVGCEDLTIEPEFPEVITNSDVTTTEETISFTANLDWELSVPQETIAFFWIVDESGNKVNKVSGEAGEVSVKIGITDQPDFDNDITCDVTLKMGEESEVIATYTILKSVKEFKAFPCKVNEDGELVYMAAGGFDYSADAVTSADLIYNNIYGAALPFTFEAGFNYDIKNVPAWMTIETVLVSDLSVGKRGTTHVLVQAELSALPEDITTGSFDIFVRNSDEKIATITVSLPDLSGVILSDLNVAPITAEGFYITNDSEGEDIENESCTFDVQTAAELTFIVAGPGEDGWWGASSHPEFAYAFATMEVGERTGEGLLKTQSVSVSFGQNNGAERTAYVFAMPAELVDQTDPQGFNPWVGDTAKGLLPEDSPWRKYLVTTFTQAGASSEGGEIEGDVISVTGAEISKMTETDDMYNALYGAFGVTELYKVNATSKFTLTSQIEFWNMEQYNDGLELVETPIFTVEPKSEYELSVSATSEVMGIIVLKTGEEDTAYAAIVVMYTPSDEPVESSPFAFVMPEYVSGATLTPAENVPAELMGMVSLDKVYQLTYTTSEPTLASLIVPSMPWEGAAFNNYPVSPDYWLTYDELGANMIWVNMNATEESTDFFIFGSMSDIQAVLICTYSPAAN